MFRQLYATAPDGVNPADSDDPVPVWITCLFVLDDPSSPAPASEPFRGPPRKGRAMGFGGVCLVMGVLWAVLLALAYLQARRFMARARALRRQGRVSIGASPRRTRGRAFVVIAVGPDDRVTAAEALQGITVFANARPVPALVGLPAVEPAGGRA